MSRTGVLDTDLTELHPNDMMLWGLANLWRSDAEPTSEGGYLVRHGRRAVRDFGPARTARLHEVNEDTKSEDNTNLFERAFPTLFPYGVGGIEAQRSVVVPFTEHVQWALRYHDRRFRTHETFSFMAFGIQQRREALFSAKLQIRRKTFEADAPLLSTITSDKLRLASLQEAHSEPITDHAVRALRKHVFATSSRVLGSDQSRMSYRRQLWSTAVKHGPPSVFCTINPNDIAHPIAQLLVGEEIDLDHVASMFDRLSSEDRARNIAKDPYGAAQFFHFLINTIITTLFKVNVTEFQTKSGMGVLGRVSAYFGTTESQGRGSLHLHLLLWLEDTPTWEEMRELLKEETFRHKITAYIKQNFRAYLPGFESAESVKAIPKEPEVASICPPHPDSTSDYESSLASFERRLARLSQVHTCEPRVCLFTDQYGQVRCKRRAPFPLSDKDYILPNGEWGQKRLYGYINGWIPSILTNAQCNNDGKLITSGEDSKNLSFYIVDYTAKKQHRVDNLSAILARGYAYHLQRSPYLDAVREQNDLMMFRLVNAINREQELSAPMVMSYLMGWGDVYRSHRYVPIFWSSFVGMLLSHFGELKRSP